MILRFVSPPSVKRTISKRSNGMTLDLPVINIGRILANRKPYVLRRALGRNQVFRRDRRRLRRVLAPEQFILRRNLVLLLLALFFAQLGANAHAQFLQTDLNTYQLPDPKKELVIVATEIGLFIAYAPNRSTPLSGFDVQQLTMENSASLFLAYGNGNFVPERIILPGAGNEFRIRGTFTVQLGKSVRLAIAMNANTIPFISVVSSQKGQESIIGFVGRQVVLNLQGSSAVEMFEADSLRHRYGEIAPPYEIRKDNRLYLSGQPVLPGAAVGIFSQPENPCLEGKSALLWEDVYHRIEDALRAQPTLRPSAEIKKYKGKLQLESVLPLIVSPESVVGVHYDTGRFVAIREEHITTESVCVAKILVFK